MANRYQDAPAVRKVARRLIDAHHAHLSGETIIYLFCAKPEKVRGAEAWATARKITGLSAYFALGYDRDQEMDEAEAFVIIVHSLTWSRLNSAQQEALIDHELSHCWVEEDEETHALKRSLLPHDLEEFGAVVSRHGLWRDDIKDFLRQAEPHFGQLTLILEAA